MQSSKSFLKICGICGIIAGLATLLLWLLPWIYGRPSGMEARLALHYDPLYILRIWTSFINIFFIVFMSWGLTLYKIKSNHYSASTGMLFLFIYAVVEFLGRSTMIFVRENRWVTRYLMESDLILKDDLLKSIQRFDEVWGGLYFLLLICFAIASFCFGISTKQEIGLGGWVSKLLLGASILAIVTLIARATGSTILRHIAIWGYPLIQPMSRFLLGLWLWRLGGLKKQSEATVSTL